MVTLKDGVASVEGSTPELAHDILGFMHIVNEMKCDNYEEFMELESVIRVICKHNTDAIETIKEFALNMTEIFN